MEAAQAQICEVAHTGTLLPRILGRSERDARAAQRAGMAISAVAPCSTAQHGYGGQGLMRQDMVQDDDRMRRLAKQVKASSR